MRLPLFLPVLFLFFAFLLVGCQSNRRDYTPHMARFFIETSPAFPTSRSIPVILPFSQTELNVDPTAVLIETDITWVEPFDAEFGPAVAFYLSREAGRDLYRISASNPGKRMVVTINEVVLGMITIQRPIEDGVISMYLEVRDEDLPELVINLQKTAEEFQRRMR
ncbi:MAG: hypothetical protein WD490_07075 [Opitutales bacterium]